MKLERLYSRYSEIIPDFREFMNSIQRPLMQSFRVNTLKAKREETLLLLKDLKIKPLPFYDDGFCVQGKSKLGNHITHNLGLIYVQEAASMIPGIVLDPRPGEVVLDLCAAPGSKTTHIAQVMKNTGLLVANEINRKRIQGLMHNIKRCGVLNEAVVGFRGQRIDRALSDYFDRILIDAPCSAEGTIRKSKAVLYHWGLKNIQRMARIQKGLLVSGFRALRPGGTLVYSTCTIAPEENEGVVSYLLEKFPEAELMPISIPHFKIRTGTLKWQGESFDSRVKNCARIVPQDNDTAPFFIAKITKRGVYRNRVDYMGKIEFEGTAVGLLARRFGIHAEQLKGYSIFHDRGASYITTPQVYSFREARALRKGLELGKVYGNEIKPDNDFVQIFAKRVNKNFYDMKEWEAKKFLKGESIRVSSHSNMSEGFVIVMYKNLPIAIGRYNGREIKSEIKRERRTL
ncbi:MAG: NOL1/NOP2/sun family putative RNA methylase [candidate division WOR-3 bacterium]|nr:MAG: NOL1/NOP2/sun family putative RNA methylase [candidate division WOR-3 bacterium]